jgi:8-oxo-dGTP diphosphatase
MVTITHSFYVVRSAIVISMVDMRKSKDAGMPLLVTAAIIFDGDRVLITRRPDDKRHPGLWEFPGGKIDPGESPDVALCREIREELDAEITVEEIFEVIFFRYDWGPVLILAYRCQLLTNTIHNIGVAEHRWVHPKDLADFSILPADQPIINRLKGISGCSSHLS